MQCAAEDVAAFVDFMRANGYLAHTNVVIVGDHLARKNPLTDRLPAPAARHIYNLFISGAEVSTGAMAAQTAQKNTEQITHFDLLPTILEFSGFEIAGGRLGLGYSAFDRHAAAPANRFDDMQSSLMNRSASYLALWGITDGANRRASRRAPRPASLLSSLALPVSRQLPPAPGELSQAHASRSDAAH